MKKICLGDVIDVIHGWAFKGEFFSATGEKLVVTPGNFFEKGGFREREGKEKFYLSEEFPKKYLLEKHDLIIAMTEQGEGLLGSSALIPENDKYLHNQRIGKVCIKQPNLIDKYYLYFLFNTLSVRKQISNSASGTKVKHTAPERIYRVEVCLPPLENQRKISNLLMSIEELESSNIKKVGILKNIIMILYQEWFINFKFPHHEQIEFVNGIPDRWSIQTINDICDTIGGGTPSTKIDAYWENGDVEWVTPTDITKLKSLILIKTEKKITRLGLEKSSAKLVPPNTILMTSRASIGFFGLIDREVCTNQGFISIIPHNEIMRYYLLLNLKSRVSEIDALASGATFKEISKSTFRKMPIVIPSDDVLKKFDQIVRPIISQIRNLEQQNDQLFKLKENLLPRLMSGELDVSKLSSIE